MGTEQRSAPAMKGKAVKDKSNSSKPKKKRKNTDPSALPDYTVYELSIVQRMVCLGIGGALFFGIGYLFYHQIIISILFMAGAFLIPPYWRNYMLNRRRAALNLHFKQALFSLSSSLSAGRSVENAFREAIQDLRMLDPDAQNDLIKEFSIICARMEYGEPIEDALQDFSRRANMEDITNFADVFTVCKRTGGDLVEIVRRTSTIIGEKLDVQQEIAVLIAQKKFESKAIMAAPILMILFMNVTSPDYMLPIYNGVGYIITTFCLAGLLGCMIWINKIMNIDL